MNILKSIVPGIVNCLAPHLHREFSYWYNSSANFENLKAELDRLVDERDSIQRRVSEAERKTEKIEEKVEKWLVNANKSIKQAAKFIQDEEKANERCLMGLFPNWITRYQHGKKAETEKEALFKLREEAGRFYDRISYRTIPEEIWIKSHKGYEAFESRLSTLKAIQNALIAVDVSIIGVYGMGGIGKTTLVKKVARQAMEDKLFDMVAFSEVSQIPDIKRIQQELAEKLGLELREEVESRRASRLFERLRNEKKILVVLDNIWEPLDLETVGIPFGDEHRGCKLLLTARDRDVLSKMGSKDFLINNLNDEEAWRLFKMTVGDDVENRELKSTAIDVARACGGLPIALTTVAKALRSKSLQEWKQSLGELRTPSMASFEGVSAKTYSSIELSFNHLKSEQLKKIFLLCSVMGNRISTVDLFKYSTGLGIFQGVNRMVDAQDKLYALVHELRHSCLLPEGDSNERFTMHDVVRDVAISIACRDQHLFLVKNEDVWDWPDEDALRKCNAISLRNNSNREFPEGLECPNLEFLYISLKDSSLEINIPENFFVGMKKLRVLDFTRMQFSSFPSSIVLLVNLHTLCLDQSTLGDIAIIGKLKNLEVLSFCKSDIMQLPEELGQLNKLRLLDLTNCLNLKVIAPNLLSSLTRLEELYMGNCFIEWEVERANSERSNASLDELKPLLWLTTLEIDLKNDSILPKGFLDRKLERFKISIGNGSFMHPMRVREAWFKSLPHFFINSNRKSLRVLKLKLDFMDICSMKLQGVNNVGYLMLDKLQGVKNVLFDLDISRSHFSQLKHLHVQNNPDILCIMDSMEMVPCDAFPLLESLILHNLINMERICIDRLKVESFNELKTVEVYNCDKLSNIFWLSTTECLPRLERIAAINGSKMKEIFAIGEEVDNAIEKIEFAQLRSLSLGNLPEVTSFCCEVDTPSASPNRQVSQEESTAMYCSSEITLDISTLLFNEKVALPNLEALEISEINVDKIWHYNHLPVMFPRFQNLTRLILRRCHKLKYIFSASMIGSLRQLQHLDIRHCEDLQEIISENRADEEIPNFVFLQLTTLRLQDLPKLRCLYPGMHTSEWPAQEILLVYRCDKLKIFAAGLPQNNENDQLGIPAQQPLLPLEKILPNLTELSLSGKDVKMILQANFPQHLFDSLRKLEIAADDSACVPIWNVLERFHNLEILSLNNFSFHEEVFSKEGCLEKHVGKLAMIKELQLRGLNHLKQLCKQDSILDCISQHLEILRVRDCQNLISLLPSSSVSFGNLTKLVAVGCKELTHLVTSSTAKTLMQLVTVRIYGCRAMTEVLIKDEDGVEEEEIVFRKLKTLELRDLDSLTSFCSANYTFNFPSLQCLCVIGCPKMKIFTTGESITPPVVYVLYGETSDKWLGANNDLNTTIQRLHAEKLLAVPSSLSIHY